MLWHRLFLAIAALVALVLPGLAERRVALVIGNGAYEHADKLSNPVIDARNIRGALAKLGFETVYGENLDQRAMRRLIGKFAQAVEGADVALVYYAGHGATFGETPYVVPVDAEFSGLENVPYELIPVETLIGEVRRAKGIRIAIMDACRDNQAEHELKRVAARGGAVSRGLAPIKNPEGLIIAYATQYLSTAADGAPMGDSPFTAALLKNIATPGLDVKDLFFKVAREVVTQSGGRQRPEVSVSLYEPYALAGAAPSPSSDERIWSFLKNTIDLAALEAFRVGLPAESSLRGEVEARIAALSSRAGGVLAGGVPKPSGGPAVDGSRRPDQADPQVAAATPAEPGSAKAPERAALIEACDRLAAAASDPDRPPGITAVTSESVDAEAAIPACRAAVKAAPEERRLQFQLGRALRAGKQFDEARRQYEKATAMGSVVAMTGLGSLYHNGLGVPKDYAAARGWYEKAAAKGEAVAMSGLGNLYNNGQGVPKDYAAAQGWYEKAAAKGEVFAMMGLGFMHHLGHGVPQDYAAARGWYEKAATKGDSFAMTGLATLYELGQGVPQDYAAARGWYEKAAAKGNALAMSGLGNLYNNGLGVPQDYAAARGWYEKAAAKGVGFAMTNLGFFYQHGHGVAQDYEAARGWYEKAAAKGEATAMSSLGFMYQNGHGVAQDYEAARGWYEKAAAKGDASAMANLGFFYQHGHGVGQDYKAARGWYEKAAAKGDASAMTNLGFLYDIGRGVTQDYEAARGWYEKAAAKGETTAMRNLGILYRDGHGVPRDYAVARGWYEKAAAKGDTAARELLGSLPRP